MDNDTYQKGTLRTESTPSHTDYVDKASILRSLRSTVQCGAKADAIKRLVFYKTSKEAPEGVPNPLQTSERTLRLLHGVLGLQSEIAEIAEPILEYLAKGLPFDVTGLKTEIGGAQFYLAILCNALDTTLGEEMQRNSDKLKARYPDGFDVDKATNRDLSAEDAASQGGEPHA